MRVENPKGFIRRGDESIFELSTELLSCPFCACMDVEGGPFPGNREETYWIINCGNPGCMCRMEAPTISEVIERWNRNRTNATRQFAYKR